MKRASIATGKLDCLARERSESEMIGSKLFERKETKVRFMTEPELEENK